MKPRPILVSSAVILGVLGLFLLFAPGEALAFLLSVNASLLATLPGQLLSGPLLGFSALN